MIVSEGKTLLVASYRQGSTPWAHAFLFRNHNGGKAMFTFHLYDSLSKKQSVILLAVKGALIVVLVTIVAKSWFS